MEGRMINSDTLFIPVMTKIGAVRVNENEYDLVRSIPESEKIKIRFVFRRNAYKRNRYGGGRRYGSNNYEGREWILASVYECEKRESGYHGLSVAAHQRFNFPGRFIRGSTDSYKPSTKAILLTKEKLQAFISVNYQTFLPSATERAKKDASVALQKEVIRKKFPTTTRIELWGDTFEINFGWGNITMNKSTGLVSQITVRTPEGLSIREVSENILKAENLRLDDEIRRTRLLRMEGEK
jgi:hypothetical protein